MNFPSNPYHSIQRFLRDRAIAAELARRKELERKAAERAGMLPSPPRPKSKFEQLVDYFSGKPGARHP